MKKSFSSINPATGLLIKEYEEHDTPSVQRKLKKAASASRSWKDHSPRERGMVLNKIAAQLLVEKESLARLMTQEMGKPIAQSREEVEKCARNLKHYAKEGLKILANEIVETDAKKSYICYQPLGVVFAIMPWNFPFWQVFRCMAPILMGGNTMILKHSSNVSGCALAIEQVVKRSGAPAGLFQTLLFSSENVAGVIADPLINAVTFTGSTAAGRKVAATAGAHLKKQVLELGGSDPYIILDDADMELSVSVCVKGRLVNSGQSCVSAKRFVVVKSRLKEFVEKFTAAMNASTFGDPLDESSTIGPLARHDLRDQLHAQVLNSIAKGAKLVCGGFIPDSPGAYYPPTVLTGVKPGMPAYDEELFGPVAAIIAAKDEEDAIRIANDNEYGLGGAIFSKDRKRAEMIAATKLIAGNCFVNSMVHSDPRLPFGGTKNSGYGRELSTFGLREFTNVKTVFIQ